MKAYTYIYMKARQESVYSETTEIFTEYEEV